jgi:tRNA pseudouridine55 synthase
VIVVDKPEGPTSFDVVARVRRALRTREVGHCGTLDPLATGVVVVCVGSYTRLVRVLTADDKRYTATIAFGMSTTTDDREGDIIARGDAATIDERGLRAAVASMSGVQMQVPPAYSAIHVDGERAYAKARRGQAVAMQPREIVIHGLSLLSFEGGRAVVDVHCGKGTYIRALARDLGARLSVPAHLHALRRTRSGAYGLEDAIALDDLDDARESALRSGVSAIRGVPLVPVTPEQGAALAQGKRVRTTVSIEGTGLAHRGEDPVALVRVEGDALVVERGFGS